MTIFIMEMLFESTVLPDLMIDHQHEFDVDLR